MENEKRSVGLDVVRFMGMCMVIGFHVGVLWWGEALMYPRSLGELGNKWRLVDFNPIYLVTLVGDQAVPMFVFLSGYLLGKRQSAPDWVWLWGRWWGLLWPYWIVLMVGAVLMNGVWTISPEVLDRTVVGEFSWDRVLWSGLLIQNFSVYTFNSPLPALWFVPMLLQLYLLVPWMWRWFQRMDERRFLLRVLRIQVVWNLLVLGVWLSGGEVLWGYFSGMAYMSVLALGMWFSKKDTVWVGGWWWKGLLIWLVGWGLRLLGNRLFMPAEATIGWGWFLVLRSIEARLITVEWLKMGLANVGRKWSYWIYLGHEPLLYVGFGMAYWWGWRWW